MRWAGRAEDERARPMRAPLSPSRSVLRDDRAAKTVVYADADQILREAMVVVDRRRRGKGVDASVVHAAQINVEIFDFGAPVRREGPFRARACSPAGPRRAR